MRSCLDKFYGRFLLWGGKRFSFSFYSLLIAKAILQWLISTFLSGLLNHPGPEQAQASLQTQGSFLQPCLPICQEKGLHINTSVGHRMEVTRKWKQASAVDPGDAFSELCFSQNTNSRSLKLMPRHDLWHLICSGLYMYPISCFSKNISTI